MTEKANAEAELSQYYIEVWSMTDKYRKKQPSFLFAKIFRLFVGKSIKVSVIFSFSDSL